MIARVTAAALQAPRRVLLWVLGLHVLIWTIVPALVNFNLPLDVVEDLALGKEWQLGYWKHPPLPWWTADLAYRATGQLWMAYALGPLASTIAMYLVWRLGCDTVGEQKALVAVLALEGLHFFNLTAVKFNHDVMQLPLWAATAWFLFRAITRARMLDWGLTGAWLALAFWTKYSVGVLGVVIGLILLIDPYARRSLRTPGPYVMAVAFLLVLAPHLGWLWNHDLMPFEHVGQRAKEAARWHEYLLFPLRWIGGQLLFLLPVIGLLALVWQRGATRPPADAEGRFARRYLAAVGLGPFVVTTLASTVLGRMLIPLWAYPFWSFAPLAAVGFLPGPLDARRLQRFACGFLVVFAAAPIVYAALELIEPLVRDRPKASQFPGRLLGETITREWRERTGTPLRYVSGVYFGLEGLGSLGEFAVNNVAAYSPDRPHVLVHADPTISPWIDMDDLRRHGAVVIWQQGPMPAEEAARLRAMFPTLEMRPPLELARQTLRPRNPVIVEYAIVPPAP